MVNALATLSHWSGVLWTNAHLNGKSVAVALFENVEFRNINGNTQLISPSESETDHGKSPL